MTDKKILSCGCSGTVIAALCCFTPVLVIALGAVGLSAWLGWVDYVLFPMMFVSLGTIAYALYLRAGSPGPSPKVAIAAMAIAFSGLIVWLEFRYALRISLAAAAVVAGYGYFLRKGSTRAAEAARPEEQS